MVVVKYEITPEEKDALRALALADPVNVKRRRIAQAAWIFAAVLMDLFALGCVLTGDYVLALVVLVISSVPIAFAAVGTYRY